MLRDRKARTLAGGDVWIGTSLARSKPSSSGRSRRTTTTPPGRSGRQAGALALRRRADLLAAGESFAIETTPSGSSTLRFMKAARASGHRTTLVYLGRVSDHLSASRVAHRVRRGGHAVPVSAVFRRYPDTLAKLPRAMELADRSLILDNSGRRRQLLLSYEEGRVRFIARDPPAWFAQTLPDLA